MNLSMRETLALLCEREIARKDQRPIEMGLKVAHFPYVRELTSFGFAAQPSVDAKQIRDLAAARWVANGENVLPFLVFRHTKNKKIMMGGVV